MDTMKEWGQMPLILLSGSNCLTHCSWLLVLPSENSLLFIFKVATDEKKNAPSGLYSFHCTLQTGINVNAWRLFKASDRRIFFSPGLWFCWQSPCPRRHSQLLIYFFHSISCIGNHTENSLLIMIFRPDLFICFITTTPSSSPILVMNFLKLSTIMVRVGSPHPQADLCHRAEFYWAFVT